MGHPAPVEKKTAQSFPGEDDQKIEAITMFGFRRPPAPIPSIDTIGDAVDRRRFPRLSLPVFYTSARQRNVRAPVVDLGQGGLRVFSDEPMLVGATFELELFLPSGDELRAVARVAWVGALGPDAAAAYDVGFELVDMAPEDRARLTAAIDDG